LSSFFILKESHTLVFSLEAWQNTPKTFPVEPVRNMSGAHNEAKLLFLYTTKRRNTILKTDGASNLMCCKSYLKERW